MKKNTDHIVLGTGGKIICMHCGGSYEPTMPCEITMMLAMSKAFGAQHKKCRKPSEPRCFACLKLGHTEADHPYASPQAWLSGGDTGISSKAIWHHMMHTTALIGDAPHDPSDFGRCHRLLAAFPEWRPRIGEMARYPEWKRLAPAWDELEALYLEELKNASGMAPKLYARMKELRT